MEDFSYEKDVEEIGNNIPQLDPDLKSQLPAQLEQLTNETDDLDTILKKDWLPCLPAPTIRKSLKIAMPINHSSKNHICRIQQGLRAARR